MQTYQIAAACPDQGQGLAFSLMRIAVAACRLDVEVARLVLREAMLGMVMWVSGRIGGLCGGGGGRSLPACRGAECVWAMLGMVMWVSGRIREGAGGGVLVCGEKCNTVPVRGVWCSVRVIY